MNRFRSTIKLLKDPTNNPNSHYTYQLFKTRKASYQIFAFPSFNSINPEREKEKRKSIRGNDVHTGGNKKKKKKGTRKKK